MIAHVLCRIHDLSKQPSWLINSIQIIYFDVVEKQLLLCEEVFCGPQFNRVYSLLRIIFDAMSTNVIDIYITCLVFSGLYNNIMRR